MARTPRYNEQEKVGGLPGTARAPAGSPLGQALQTAGNIGERFVDDEFRRSERDRTENERKLQEREDRKAQLDAVLATDSARREFTTYLNEQQSATQGDPTGFAGRVDDYVDNTARKMLEGVTNERGYYYLSTQLSNLRTSMFQQAKQFEATRGIQYDATANGNLAESLSRDLVGDDSQYEAYRALSDDGIDASRMGPEQRERMRDVRDKQFRAAAATGAIQRDPARILAATDGLLGITASDSQTINFSGNAPADVAAVLSDLTGTKVTAPDGAKPVTLKIESGKRRDVVNALSAAIGIAPPDIKATGAAKQSGIPWLDSSNADEIARYRSAAMTRLAQDRQGERARIEQRDRDAVALASQGKQDPAPIPPERYVAAFGPEEGARRAAEAAKTQVYAADRAALRGMPAADMEALVKSRAPTGVEGAAGDVSRQQSLARAVADEQQAREADAPGYVIKASPIVARAADAVFGPSANGQPRWLDMSIPVAERQAAMQNYLTQSTAEQQRLGIRKVQMLPAEAEAYIVRAAKSLTTPNDRGQVMFGDQIAARIEGLAQTFGAYWPAVHGQVVGGKDGASVPDSFIVVPGVASLPGREEVARAEGSKVEDLKKQAEAVSSGAGKDVETKVGEALAPFFAAMMPTGQNTRTADAMRSVATKLALTRVIGGMKVSDAAQAAAGVLVGHLDFPTEGSTRTYAVPKAQDPSAVRNGVKAANDRIGLWDLPPPPDMSGATPEATAAAWAQLVQARPQWVINGDESGLLLYTTGENGRAVQVRWKDGKQVEFKWDALRALASESRAGPGSSVTQPSLSYRPVR